MLSTPSESNRFYRLVHVKMISEIAKSVGYAYLLLQILFKSLYSLTKGIEKLFTELYHFWNRFRKILKML